MKYAIIIICIILIIIISVIFKSTSFTARIRKAEEYLESGTISKANEIVKKILERRSDYAPARYLRALILIKQSQYLLAISELNAVLQIPQFNKYVNEVDIHYHLARLYKETKNYPKEIEEYKSILTFNPEDLVANHRIGHALYQKKDYRKARDHFIKALAADPNLTDIYLPLGISCYNISDYDKAEEFLIKSLGTPGDHEEAEFHLGLIYFLKKDKKNAIQMFERAKRNRAYALKSLQKIGEIYFHQQEYDNAIEVLEEGLLNLKEKNPESHEYRYLLAECYENQNKIKEACHHWSKIIEENPSFRNTRQKLESYQEILNNDSLMTVFVSTLDALQPSIVEMISSLNYNIISKEKIGPHEYYYKAYNIKRINDPPILIYFHRTTREIGEEHINEFQKLMTEDKCKNGIYIATSKFSARTKALAQSKNIELYDSEYVKKVFDKIQARKKIK
ncbi:MAG: tetratricopeptide repeat protein [Spirochaetes bacterium]|nr:tetratricopeptide repeat protein [Spirochaetota bacterium]